MKRSDIDTHTKNNINYFKRSDTLGLVGGILLAFGVVCVWLGFSFSFIGYRIGIICAPVGLILFIIGFAGNVSDENIEFMINNKMAGLDISIDNERSYQLKLLKNQKEILIEGYRFHDGVMIKKLKSGELRTSEFSRSKIRILSDRLYILNREISLIYDDKTVTNVYEPTYDKIVSVEVVRDQRYMEFNKNTFLIKPCLIVITTDDEVISLPCVNAVTTDEIVKSILKQMNEYKSNLSSK